MRIRVRGQSMVEMALIMPLFVLLIMGIIEFGWYVFTYSELENATRRGSEWAAKSPPVTENSRDDNSSDRCALLIKQEVLKHITMNELTLNNIRITYPDRPLRDINVPIEVTVNYVGQWLTPLGRGVFGDNLQFNFTSRRTIVSTQPPEGLNSQCST